MQLTYRLGEAGRHTPGGPPTPLCGVGHGQAVPLSRMIIFFQFRQSTEATSKVASVLFVLLRYYSASPSAPLLRTRSSSQERGEVRFPSPKIIFPILGEGAGG